VTVATTEGMWIDEGLPPHLGRQLTENLNENCQDEQEVVYRWHGHLGHRTEGPTMFFFLWGFMKFRVYGNGNRKQSHELKLSVEAAANTANAMEHTFLAATSGGLHGVTRWSFINSGLLVNVLNS
jgi:hypothetical protein